MSLFATPQSTTLKTTASVLMGLFLAVGLLWTGPAVAQDEPTVSIQSQQAEAGQAVDVPVTVTEFDSIGAVTLVVNYDPNVLSLSDTEGLIEGAPRDFSANVSEPGELRINWFDATGENPIVIGDGTLLTITFSEFAGGTSNLTFGADSELADETAATIETTFEDGVVSGELSTLSAGSVPDAELNQTVSVPLSGDDLQNVGSASIEIAFDDAALQFERIANDNSGLDLQANASDGVVSIGGFNTDGTSLGENFVEVEFSFLGGSSNLSILSDTEISDVSGNPIESAFEDGSVSGDAPTLSFADRNVQPGDTVSVPVQASDIQELGAASVDVTFSAASFSFVGTENPIVEGLQAGNTETGVVNIGFFDTGGVDPADNDGKLVDLRFAVADEFAPGSQTTLGFDATQSELSNTSGTPYNTSYESGTVTSIDRQVALGTQALDLTADDTELQVTSVTAEAGDVVVITTDDGDGEFTDETVVGAREIGSELNAEDLLVDVRAGGDTEDAQPGDHAAHVSTDGTVGGVVATSGTAPIYGVAQFDWQDETVIEDTSVVTVDAIEILYDGNVGADTLSIDLHDASGGSVGAFIGVSQEDLAVGEVHEDVAIDVLEPRGPGDDSERVEDVIDETGEFFAMAHLGPAGTDANGDRIPAQQPALATTVDPGTVGDFATVGIGLAVDVTRDFGDASDQANYELVALPGEANVDVAETVSGEQGPNWRVFRELGATNDGDAALEEYDGSDAFNFREGRAFWVIAQSPLSFQGTVSPTTVSAIALQGGWNAVSNPLQSDLDWQSVQDANGLDEALWRWDGGWSQVDTLESAQTGEGYYVFNSAGIDSLSLNDEASGNALAAKTSNPQTVELTARTDGEDGSSVTVGIGSETSIYHAPPAHFASSKTTLRILGSDSDAEYARMVKPVDEESTTFSLMLRGAENETATIETGGLDAAGPEGAVLVNESTDETYDLQETSTVSVTTGDDGEVPLSLQVGASDQVRQIATPEETRLQGNYPNPFSERTTVELALSEQADVKVQVYNVLGQQVATVADGQLEAGNHELEWDGSSLSSGVYFVRMEAGDVTDTHKITVVR